MSKLFKCCILTRQRMNGLLNFGCTHHMMKDASLFSSLDMDIEKNIYVVDDFTLDITGNSEIPCRHGQIVDMYHVPGLTVNLLSVFQLTQTGKIV